MLINLNKGSGYKSCWRSHAAFFQLAFMKSFIYVKWCLNVLYQMYRTTQNKYKDPCDERKGFTVWLMRFYFFLVEYKRTSWLHCVACWKLAVYLSLKVLLSLLIITTGSCSKKKLNFELRWNYWTEATFTDGDSTFFSILHYH